MKKDSKINPQTAELIAKGHQVANPSSGPGFIEDKRKTARQEHTNHFTNRAGEGKQ